MLLLLFVMIFCIFLCVYALARCMRVLLWFRLLIPWCSCSKHSSWCHALASLWRMCLKSHYNTHAPKLFNEEPIPFGHYCCVKRQAWQEIGLHSRLYWFLVLFWGWRFLMEIAGFAPFVCSWGAAFSRWHFCIHMVVWRVAASLLFLMSSALSRLVCAHGKPFG